MTNGFQALKSVWKKKLYKSTNLEGIVCIALFFTKLVFLALDDYSIDWADQVDLPPWAHRPEAVKSFS